jgi:hypothetical protein
MRGPLATLMMTGAISVCLWLADGRLPVTAQTRFHVVSTQPLDGVKDLQVVTVRDDVTASCYAAFVLGSANGASMPPPPQPWLSERGEKVQLAAALKDLNARRDRQFAELRASSANAWAVNYESAREAIEDEYERAVRDLMPELYPSAQVAPGWRTTSIDELDAAVRRAIAEGEAEEAAQARTALNGQLLGALTADRPALAVVGPVACQATKK